MNIYCLGTRLLCNQSISAPLKILLLIFQGQHPSNDVSLNTKTDVSAGPFTTTMRCSNTSYWLTPMWRESSWLSNFHWTVSHSSSHTLPYRGARGCKRKQKELNRETKASCSTLDVDSQKLEQGLFLMPCCWMWNLLATARGCQIVCRCQTLLSRVRG